MLARSSWRAAFVAVLASAGLVASWAALGAAQAAGPAAGPRDEAPPARSKPAGSQTARIYFVRGERFAPVTRRLPAGPARETAVIEALLAGPTTAERKRGIETTIPLGTRVLSLKVASGSARLALRTPGKAPTARDVALRPARAAQIAYTLTSLPGIEHVQVRVDGAKRATFAGSQLVVGRALDRHALSRPIRLAPQPLRVPGPAPADARAVQTRLQGLSYLPRGAATGVWDYRTTQAVLAFQGRHGLARDGIVGPQTIAALEIAEAPRPAGVRPGRRIEVHRDAGLVLLVQGAKVVRAVHASSGGPAYETPRGSYAVFRKERNSWSVPYKVWLPYASYFNGGIAIHASDDVPSRPVSHGCVRVPAPEAPFVYAFAALGTPVVVV